MIDKIENPQSNNKSRIIFDYSRVTELFPSAHLKLSSKVHDHFFNSRYECLFSTDLKHAYLIISLHLNNKHYFAFTIFDID